MPRSSLLRVTATITATGGAGFGPGDHPFGDAGSTGSCTDATIRVRPRLGDRRGTGRSPSGGQAGRSAAGAGSAARRPRLHAGGQGAARGRCVRRHRRRPRASRRTLLDDALRRSSRRRRPTTSRSGSSRRASSSRRTCPRTCPKKVVYPFAGGDLSTALTVYPDADEITTISLEPAGDPRDLATLKGKRARRRRSTKVEYELKFLYRVNFSNTINMIDAMRAGALPTAADLRAVGAEDPRLRGRVAALLQAQRRRLAPLPRRRRRHEGAAIRRRRTRETRNCVFANVELQFRKPGGRDPGLSPHPREPRQRGARASARPQEGSARAQAPRGARARSPAMTKAASYLLSWESFSTDARLPHRATSRGWCRTRPASRRSGASRPASSTRPTARSSGRTSRRATAISKDWRTEFDSRAQARSRVPVRLLRQEEREPPHHHDEEEGVGHRRHIVRVEMIARVRAIARSRARASMIVDGGRRVRAARARSRSTKAVRIVTATRRGRAVARELLGRARTRARRRGGRRVESRRAPRRRGAGRRRAIARSRDRARRASRVGASRCA